MVEQVPFMFYYERLKTMLLDFFTQPLFGLILLGLAGWYWSEARRIHEYAVKLVKESCKQHEVQLLDATIRLQSWRIYLDRSFYIQRTYRFEISADGQQRLFGWIILHSDRARELQLQNIDGQLIYQTLH